MVYCNLKTICTVPSRSLTVHLNEKCRQLSGNQIMSETSLKNSDNYQNLVYCNLKIISSVQSHGVTVHQVSTESNENYAMSLPEISHIWTIFKE